MAKIEELFFLPPMAVARLGGSSVPLVSYTWLEDPSLHGAGLTVISPSVSLEVLADGAVRPFLPAAIQFRDGDKFRPVAPFLELWVRSNGTEQPVTLQWMSENKAALSDIQYTVTAANRKAARRSGDAACAFSAQVKVAGDDHASHAMLAFSTGTNPLVFPEKPIPLGHFQVIRPTPAAAMGVDLSALRVRFTPATGQVYGPPNLEKKRDPDNPVQRNSYELVPRENGILNENAAWMHYNARGRRDNPQPSDTYDGSGDNTPVNRSFGVVDDTCDVLLEANIKVGGKNFTAAARIFCGPPDYAPDRRPFCSLADELIDRDPPPPETEEDLQSAVVRIGDLFQRVFETASLANLDSMRNSMLPGNSRGLQNFPGMPGVSLPDSMTKNDPEFDKEKLAELKGPRGALVYSSLASQTHAPMADADDLALFLRTHADRVRHLIRPAYAHFKDLQQEVRSDRRPDPRQRDPRNNRDGLHDMRMPPYMRDSDASPLSLNRRQYEFLMQTLDRLQAEDKKRAATGAVAGEFNLAQDHLSRVVSRMADGDSDAPETPAPAAAPKPKPRKPAPEKGRR
jgi:hypothetical protein